MFSPSSLPSTTTLFSAYTTVAASTVLLRTLLNEARNMANQLVPLELQEKILSKLGILLRSHSSQMCIVIDEHTSTEAINEVYEAAVLYLQNKITSTVKKLKVSKASGENSLSVTMHKGEEIVDMYDGIQFVWKMIAAESQKHSADYEGSFCSETTERRSFELSFDKKYHETALSSYLFHVLEMSKAMKEANKVVNLQVMGDHYGGVVLNHPSTFETLAMDPILKKEIIDDLNRFLKRKDYYTRVGKAWKRGYLLYGPPGTGKSSLIAAMANYLKFDIYDMELASMTNNGDLRRLLVSTKNKSIIVIEDIDCSVDLENREAGASGKNDSQLTLSGLLNFIDGLWSSCGDERIIVFTTNHKDRLDPALLRPGRMDMHIHMSYCTPDAFRTLASNYLGIATHEKFGEIDKLLIDIQATPADIAEQFMRSNETDAALDGLIKFLNTKKTGESKQNAEDIEVKNGRNEEVANSDVAGKGKSYRRKSRRRANRR